VLALDFSKAFDAVRHSTLVGNMARLALYDAIYNWMIDFSAVILDKFADDTDVIVPAVNSDTSTSELMNVET